MPQHQVEKKKYHCNHLNDITVNIFKKNLQRMKPTKGIITEGGKAATVTSTPGSRPPDNSSSRTFIDDSSPVLAIEGCTLYDVVFGVSPVQALCCIVDGQAVWPEQGGVGDNSAETAIHSSALDLGRLAPVCPEQCTAKKS